MRNLSSENRRWTYAAVSGLLAGVLVAGLTFRLSSHVPSTVATGSGGYGATDGSAVAVTGSGGTTAGGPNGASAAGGRSGSGGGGRSTSGTANSGAGTIGTNSGGGLIGPSRTGSGPSGTGGSSGGALTATDVGVSATTIKVGVAILTLGAGAAFIPASAGPTPQMEQQMWQAFIDQVNASGGISGRKIVPFYQQVDVTNANAQQSTCTTWTQTDHVFAVLDANSLQSTGQLCVTAENHTIEIGSTESYSTVQTYNEARGLLITQAANATRMFADWGKALQHLGKLQGRTIGLLVDQGDGQTAANQGLVPVLKSLGDKIAYTAVVSTDPSQGPSQAAAAAPQMRAAGVNLVFDATNFVNASGFMQAADNIAWKPQYTVSSWDGADVGDFNDALPKSFDGAIAITYYPFTTPPHPENPVAHACRDAYNRLTRSNFQPTSSNWATQGYMTMYCQDVSLLATAGRAAGPDLTRSSFVGAVEALSNSFNFGALGGSFGPGKTDWADHVRAAVWGPSDGSSINCTIDGSHMCFNDDGAAFNPEA
jgi:ABC-type branched-subunit amino acid transport system substrate-binding protein